MPRIDFRYTPTSGPITGQEVMNQTEAAINELGATMQQTDETAAQALDTARNAQTTAQDALATAQGAATDAANAIDAANSATTAAQTAVAEAEDAKTAATAAIDEAANASSSAALAQEAAQEAQTVAQEATASADEAKDLARQAENTAQAALTTAQAANAMFITTSGDADANSETDPDKIYFDGSGIVANLPTPHTSGYLEIYTDDNDKTVLQIFYPPNASGTYIRRATLTENEDAEIIADWSEWAYPVPLSSSIDSDETTTAASSKAVKVANDNALAAQATAIWESITGKPANYPPAAHNHDAGNITSGALPIARGGTGSGSKTGALSNLGFNCLTGTNGFFLIPLSNGLYGKVMWGEVTSGASGAAATVTFPIAFTNFRRFVATHTSDSTSIVCMEGSTNRANLTRTTVKVFSGATGASVSSQVYVSWIAVGI